MLRKFHVQWGRYISKVFGDRKSGTVPHGHSSPLVHMEIMPIRGMSCGVGVTQSRWVSSVLYAKTSARSRVFQNYWTMQFTARYGCLTKFLGYNLPTESFYKEVCRLGLLSQRDMVIVDRSIPLKYLNSIFIHHCGRLPTVSFMPPSLVNLFYKLGVVN